MPNYKLLIEYDGSKFWGWQYQPKFRTVQGELENALALVFKQKVTLFCAGRTDRGVHALGQVANFKCAEKIASGVLLRSLNGITKPDVVVHEVTEVPESFHSRFDARARQYIYHIQLAPIAVSRQYVFYCRFPLNIDKMQTAAQALYGEHSFEAFSQYMPEEKHYLCDVDLIEWLHEGDRLALRIRANRFLHSMIRMIVGTLIQVGREKITPAEFQAILIARQRRHIGFKASPQGLFLEKVYY